MKAFNFDRTPAWTSPRVNVNLKIWSKTQKWKWTYCQFQLLRILVLSTSKYSGGDHNQWLEIIWKRWWPWSDNDDIRSDKDNNFNGGDDNDDFDDFDDDDNDEKDDETDGAQLAPTKVCTGQLI